MSIEKNGHSSGQNYESKKKDICLESNQGYENPTSKISTFCGKEKTYYCA
jgi:hypothetical protein